MPFRDTFKRMRNLLIKVTKFDHIQYNMLKLQIRKLRPSETLRLAQGHRAGYQQRWSLKS